jgi:hypothetical protein
MKSRLALRLPYVSAAAATNRQQLMLTVSRRSSWCRRSSTSHSVFDMFIVGRHLAASSTRRCGKSWADRVDLEQE